jgi:hypothetical protein
MALVGEAVSGHLAPARLRSHCPRGPRIAHDVGAKGGHKEMIPVAAS